MNHSDEMQGGCLCGAVRFTAHNVEPGYHACHCGMCRRWVGGAFLGVDVGSISFDNEDKIRRFDSSDWAARGFCDDCGTNLFYYLKPADRYSVCAGAFDDQSQLKLTNEIFIDHKPQGYRFAGDLHAMTEAEVMAKYAPQQE